MEETAKRRDTAPCEGANTTPCKGAKSQPASFGPVATRLLGLLHEFGERVPLPAVSALHLPASDPAPVEGSHKASGFCALELANGSIGLSYLLGDEHLAALRAFASSGDLAGSSALDLAAWYPNPQPGPRTLGFAAVNAISQEFLRVARYRLEAASDSIGLLEPRPGEHIGMVGLFGPLVRRIVETGARLTVLELDAALAGEFDGYQVTLDPCALARCDKILCTTTVLLNDTLDDILHACRNAGFMAMIGPGGSCMPDPLFARGVAVLGGTQVIDREGLIAAIRRGEPWGRYTRKYCIRSDRYPGFAQLLGAM